MSRYLSLVILSALAFSAPFFAQAANKGLAVMKKVDARDVGQDFQAQMQMTVDKGSRKEQRQLLWWNLDQSKGQKNLIKFQSPKSLKNTGLLVHSPENGEDLIWLFLSQAAKKEPRQIAASQKRGRFLGSEFSYVDFEDRELNEFNYKYLGTCQTGSFSCHKVQAIPKDKSYAYSRLTFWVDKNSWVPVKIELFEKDQKLKEYEVQKLEKVSDIWTVKQSTMKNLKSKRQSQLKILQIQYNVGLKEDFFTQQKLTTSL